MILNAGIVSSEWAGVWPWAFAQQNTAWSAPLNLLGALYQGVPATRL